METALQEPVEVSAELAVLGEADRVFVQTYLQLFDPVKAYKHAFPKADKEAAWDESQMLLARPDVVAAVRGELRTVGITAERVMMSLAEIAWGWARTRKSKTISVARGNRHHEECERLPALLALARAVGLVDDRMKVETVTDVRVVFGESVRAGAAGEVAAEADAIKAILGSGEGRPDEASEQGG